MPIGSPVADRRPVILAVSLLIAGIALTDWLLVPGLHLELFYFFPLLLGALFLDRQEIIAFAIICTVLQEQFGPSPWAAEDAARFVITLVAYFALSMLVYELDRRQQSSSLQMAQISNEIARRGGAEEQLRSLVEGSPAAIFTLGPDGSVLQANEAAHQLLKFDGGTLEGRSIDEYLPVLATLRQTSQVRHLVRTMIECTGRRRGGESFLAHVWVSSFGPPSATGLTAVVFDSSEQLRDREELGLQTLATSTRVIMGAYWHETRNMCTAMRVTVNSLKRLPGVAETEEVEALNSLVAGLEKLSSAELRPESEQEFENASLRAVLEHLRIVIDPWFQEFGVNMGWSVGEDVPVVCADHHGILQVFLNLARNARRVLETSEIKEFSVTASLVDDQILVRFYNSGPPVADPSTLFEPFQPAAAGRGIGLYVSRAIVRSFGGDLRYEPAEGGSTFTVVLKPGGLWYTYKYR